MSNAAAEVATAAAHAGRRASAAALTAVNTASHALGLLAKRQRVAGAVTRLIPERAKSAKELAAVSMLSIIPRATLIHDQANQARLRYLAKEDNRYMSTYHDDDSDDDDDDDNNVEHDHPPIPQPPNAKGPNPFGSTTVNDDTGTFSKLVHDIELQRHLLRPKDAEEFDCSWGLDPTGEFARGSSLGRKDGLGAEEAIKRELAFVREEAARKTAKLAQADNDHIGLEILHLFVLDLLGRNTNAARIFNAKTGALVLFCLALYKFKNANNVITSLQLRTLNTRKW